MSLDLLLGLSLTGGDLLILVGLMVLRASSGRLLTGMVSLSLFMMRTF